MVSDVVMAHENAGGLKVEFRAIDLLSGGVSEERFKHFIKFLTTFDPFQTVQPGNHPKSIWTSQQSHQEKISELVKERWKKETENHWLEGIKKLIGTASQVIGLIQVGNPVRFH